MDNSVSAIDPVSVVSLENEWPEPVQPPSTGRWSDIFRELYSGATTIAEWNRRFNSGRDRYIDPLNDVDDDVNDDDINDDDVSDDDDVNDEIPINGLYQEISDYLDQAYAESYHDGSDEEDREEVNDDDSESDYEDTMDEAGRNPSFDGLLNRIDREIAERAGTEPSLFQKIKYLEEKIIIKREWLNDFFPEQYKPQSTVIVSGANNYAPHNTSSTSRWSALPESWALSWLSPSEKLVSLESELSQLEKKLRAVRSRDTIPTNKEKKIAVDAYKQCKQRFDSSKKFSENSAARNELGRKLETLNMSSDVIKHLCQLAYLREKNRARRNHRS